MYNNYIYFNKNDVMFYMKKWNVIVFYSKKKNGFHFMKWTTFYGKNDLNRFSNATFKFKTMEL